MKQFFLSKKEQARSEDLTETYKMKIAKTLFRQPIEWKILFALLLLMALRLFLIAAAVLKEL